jgi:hypothetical protein
MGRTNCKPPPSDVHDRPAMIGGGAAFTYSFFWQQKLAAVAFG